MLSVSFLKSFSANAEKLSRKKVTPGKLSLNRSITKPACRHSKRESTTRLQSPSRLRLRPTRPIRMRDSSAAREISFNLSFPSPVSEPGTEMEIVSEQKHHWLSCMTFLLLTLRSLPPHRISLFLWAQILSINSSWSLPGHRRKRMRI